MLKFVLSFLVAYFYIFSSAYTHPTLIQRQDSIPDDGIHINSSNPHGPPLAFPACSVRMYKERELQGEFYTLWTKPKGDCIRFPNDYDKQVKSIDTYDLCIVLWTGPRCNGRAMRLSRYSYGTRNLFLVGFGKLASSLQVCTGVDIHDSEAIRPTNLGPEYKVENHPSIQQPINIDTNINNNTTTIATPTIETTIL